jgi:hypothetical protein
MTPERWRGCRSRGTSTGRQRLEARGGNVRPAARAVGADLGRAQHRLAVNRHHGVARRGFHPQRPRRLRGQTLGDAGWPFAHPRRAVSGHDRVAGQAEVTWVIRHPDPVRRTTIVKLLLPRPAPLPCTTPDASTSVYPASRSTTWSRAVAASACSTRTLVTVIANPRARSPRSASDRTVARSESYAGLPEA